MTSRCILREAVVFVALLLATPACWAGPFSDLIVFGDSLSDIGNIDQSTLGIQPGRFYYDGRFSNGPVWAELLANHLGLPQQTPSARGGGNFAHGGAQTAGTGGFQGIFIDDVDEQIDDFLSAGPADPNALVVVFAGANDLFYGQTNVSEPVGNLVDYVQRLVAAQARSLMVMNLPLLGATPRFNRDAVASAAMNALSADFNSQLAEALDDLESSHPEVAFFRLDVAGLISEGIANPEAFGLTNVTDPAAPGLESGALFYDDDLIVRDPNEYLFWDEIHPTAAAHVVLAERALAALRNPADFNSDWYVDGGDLLQWQDDFGLNPDSDADGNGQSDGADFLIWQQLQRDGSSVRNVAEPAANLLATVLAIIALLGRRCSISRTLPHSS